MALNLTSLALFVRIAALRAIGRAGAEFGWSPATASQRLRALEAELGVSLFQRTTRAVTLTTEGERFLPHAQRVLASVEDAEQALAGDDTQARGQLRVTASATFATRHLMPHVPAFLRAHPAVSLHLDLSDSVVDLVEGGYDLALRIGVLASSTLQARRLAASPRLLVAAPSYLEARGAPQTIADLADHDCLVLAGRRAWTLAGPDDTAATVRVSGRFACNAGDAIRAAATAGLGIAEKSLWDAYPALQAGTLTAVLPGYRVLPDWHVWAVRPGGIVEPPRVRVFTTYLRDMFASLPQAHRTADA